jgi:hypothetical protein
MGNLSRSVKTMLWWNIVHLADLLLVVLSVTFYDHEWKL